MSCTLSTNSGSVESLKVSLRSGCRPKAAQIRRMVVCDRPGAAAIERIDQCVASFGVVFSVRSSPRRPDRPIPCPADGPILVGQPLDPVLYEPPAPLADSVLVHSEPRADLLALKPLCTEEDHPAPVRQRARRLVTPHLEVRESRAPRCSEPPRRHSAYHRITPEPSQVNDTKYSSGCPRRAPSRSSAASRRSARCRAGA